MEIVGLYRKLRETLLMGLMGSKLSLVLGIDPPTDLSKVIHPVLDVLKCAVASSL